MTTSDGTTATHGSGRYAEVNGINLYFETHGAGRPLILLHGGLGSGEMFGPTLDRLAERRQVIVVDLQGHGRTADIDRPLDPRRMAETWRPSSTTWGWTGRTWWANPLAAGWRSTPRPGTRPRSGGWWRPRPTSALMRSIRRCASSRAR